MLSVFPDEISVVDHLAAHCLGLDEETLIRRAGAAVAEEIAKRRGPTSVMILCGGGNNGADGYAAALSLSAMGYAVQAVDVFAKGQRSEGGRAVLAEYRAVLGAPLTLDEAFEREAEIYVDALLGTGARYDLLTEEGLRILSLLQEKNAFLVAVDLPLGVDAAYGRVAKKHLAVDLTVMLSYAKLGLLSYPAREACGELVLREMGLVLPEITAQITTHLIADDEYVKNTLPKRKKNTHKGSFGRVALVAGSQKYRGAALLAAEGAARMGVGYVSLYTEETVLSFVGRRRPELLFEAAPSSALWTEEDIGCLACALSAAGAVVLGPGCGGTDGILRLAECLLRTEGAPLVLDADALNVLARSADRGRELLKNARRHVCLTPHPTELSRLTGYTTAAIQSDRMAVAMEYARETGVFLLLKGASTVITDGQTVSVNLSGSSALAKGGSGDVLAGMVGALLAQGAAPLDALRMGAYLHGRAGEALAETRSEYGVLPSELPLAVAREIKRILD